MPSLVEIGPVFLEKKILKFHQCINFSLFLNYLPFEKGGTPHLNKRESPSPKDAVLNWLSGSEEDFLNFVNVFSLFLHYIPPLKRAGSFI